MISHIILVTGSRAWRSERLVRNAFNDVFRSWGLESVTRPLLVSGHCRDGADAIAERVWNGAGFEIEPFAVSPDSWRRHGRRAPLLRNQAMVDFVAAQRDRAKVLCVGFAARCTLETCHRIPPGHVTHGTGDCMSRALQAGIEVREVNDPQLPPLRSAS
ncbi:MAG: SLOG family protein [Pseudonocardiaceae bacterium]